MTGNGNIVNLLGKMCETTTSKDIFGGFKLFETTVGREWGERRRRGGKNQGFPLLLRGTYS